MKNALPVLTCLLVSSFEAFAVDDRGNTATQGADTWSRAALYMMPRPKLVNGQLTLVPPVKLEVSQLMDPAAPQSPFAAPWSLTPNPNTVHLTNISMVFCFGQDAIDGTNPRNASGWQPDHRLHQPRCDRKVF